MIKVQKQPVNFSCRVCLGSRQTSGLVSRVSRGSVVIQGRCIDSNGTRWWSLAEWKEEEEEGHVKVLLKRQVTPHKTASQGRFNSGKPESLGHWQLRDSPAPPDWTSSSPSSDGLTCTTVLFYFFVKNVQVFSFK